MAAAPALGDSRPSLEKPAVSSATRGPAPKPAGRLYSLVAGVIPRLSCSRFSLGRRAARLLHRLYERAPGPVLTTVHGAPVLLNPGNPYPSLVRTLPYFNAPLVELVHQVARTRKRPVSVIDVGAAAGDTVLLLQERCASDIAAFWCIDGDEEFFPLLEHNVGAHPQVSLTRALLAARPTRIRSLVKAHQGTAASQGDTTVEAVPLDSLAPPDRLKTVDVLKIDVDGFDGEVLRGASALLRRDKPAVIFEWHPVLIDRAGQDFYAAFAALEAAGYTRMVWFDNVGTFSHFTSDFSANSLANWTNYLLKFSGGSEEHFDVIALHADDPIDVVTLSEMAFASRAARLCA